MAKDSTKTCPDCAEVNNVWGNHIGNGLCGECKGEGRVDKFWLDVLGEKALEPIFGDSDTTDVCPKCNGEKQCQTCGGKGIIYYNSERYSDSTEEDNDDEGDLESEANREEDDDTEISSSYYSSSYNSDDPSNRSNDNSSDRSEFGCMKYVLVFFILYFGRTIFVKFFPNIDKREQHRQSETVIDKSPPTNSNYKEGDINYINSNNAVLPDKIIHKNPCDENETGNVCFNNQSIGDLLIKVGSNELFCAEKSSGCLNDLSVGFHSFCIFQKIGEELHFLYEGKIKILKCQTDRITIPVNILKNKGREATETYLVSPQSESASNTAVERCEYKKFGSCLVRNTTRYTLTLLFQTNGGVRSIIINPGQEQSLYDMKEGRWRVSGVDANSGVLGKQVISREVNIVKCEEVVLTL